ncbi:MAG: hypothetical protein AB7U75_07670 [Hyphomicrobiaceae bacterium]
MRLLRIREPRPRLSTKASSVSIQDATGELIFLARLLELLAEAVLMSILGIRLLTGEQQTSSWLLGEGRS